MNRQEIIATIQNLPIQEQKQIVREVIENLAKPKHLPNLNQKAENEVRAQLNKRIDELLSLFGNPGPQDLILEAILNDPEIHDLKRRSKRRQRQEWKEAHRAEYAGKYIALDGNRLLGVGNNYVEARKAAIQAGVKDAYIDYMQSLDEEIFMGGW